MAMLTVAVGCTPEEKVTRYKPFFSGIGDAQFNTAPVNPNTGAIDPTAVNPETELVVEADDGARIFRAPSPRAVMSHVEALLDENTPEGDQAMLDQLVSEQTIAHYRKENKNPMDFIRELRARRKDVARTFVRMPMAQHTPTVIVDQPGDNVWCIRLTGAAAKDLRYTKLWVRLEKRQWKLMWLS